MQPRRLLATFATRVHCWFIVSLLSTRTPVILYQAAFQPLLMYGVIPPQVQDFAFPFVEINRIPVDPVLQLIEVPLNGSTTILLRDVRSSHQPLAAPGPGLPPGGRKLEPCLVHLGTQSSNTTAAFPFAGSTSSEAEHVSQTHTHTRTHAHTHTQRTLTWLTIYWTPINHEYGQ